VDDCLKRQTVAATPAEPGDLPWGLGTVKKISGVMNILAA